MASILFCGKSCRNENNYVILHNAILHNPSINNCLLEKGILSDNHGTKRPTDLLFMLWLKNY